MRTAPCFRCGQALDRPPDTTLELMTGKPACRACLVAYFKVINADRSPCADCGAPTTHVSPGMQLHLPDCRLAGPS